MLVARKIGLDPNYAQETFFRNAAASADKAYNWTLGPWTGAGSGSLHGDPRRSAMASSQGWIRWLPTSVATDGNERRISSSKTPGDLSELRVRCSKVASGIWVFLSRSNLLGVL